MTSFEDPVRAYIEALKRLAKAEANAEALASAVASVAAKIGDWKSVHVSGNEDVSGISIDGTPWPNGGQLADALAAWHEARADMEEAWRSVPPGDRASLQPPLSCQDSSTGPAETALDDVPTTFARDELGREVEALARQLADAQRELELLGDQFIETGTVENLPSRAVGPTLSKETRALTMVAEAERKRDEIRGRLAEAKDRLQRIEGERDREKVLDRLKQAEERLRGQ